tara:strand:- start:137 stop:496 length:360 start_codon:yes stop_codon:yes gene_type:complete
MTAVEEFITNPYPDRKGLRNFRWTHQAVEAWEEIWNTLWHLGYKWEWQNSDRYVRRRGQEFMYFAVHNDAVRLDMAIPLPQIHVIEEARELLLEDPGDDSRYDHAVGMINRFLKQHYAP